MEDNQKSSEQPVELGKLVGAYASIFCMGLGVLLILAIFLGIAVRIFRIMAGV